MPEGIHNLLSICSAFTVRNFMDLLAPQVLRLWLERKILPESVLRRFMDDIGSSNDDLSSGFSFRRPSRAERSVDDPIREMEGMLVDEYGRFVSSLLPFPFLELYLLFVLQGFIRVCASASNFS